MFEFRSGVLIAAIIMAVIAPAFAQQSPTPPAEAAPARIQTPGNGDAVTSPFKVQIANPASGAAPAVDKGAVGHHVLLIDATLGDDDITQPIKADAQHILFRRDQIATMVMLAPGTHTLQIVRANANNMPLKSTVQPELITITVKAPTTMATKAIGKDAADAKDAQQTQKAVEARQAQESEVSKRALQAKQTPDAKAARDAEQTRQAPVTKQTKETQNAARPAIAVKPAMEPRKIKRIQTVRVARPALNGRHASAALGVKRAHGAVAAERPKAPTRVTARHRQFPLVLHRFANYREQIDYERPREGHLQARHQQQPRFFYPTGTPLWAPPPCWMGYQE